MDSRVSLLKTGHPGISSITFFCEDSEVEIETTWSLNVGELHARISDLSSIYFWRYDLGNLGFYAGSKIQSQTGDLGKIVRTFVSGIGFELCKKFQKLHGM